MMATRAHPRPRRSSRCRMAAWLRAMSAMVGVRPGADGPDRLVGHDRAARPWRRRASCAASCASSTSSVARPAIRPRSRRCTARPAGPPASAASALALSRGIGLAQALPALGMADDDRRRPGVRQHRRADRAGESALGLLVAVLAADDDAGAGELGRDLAQDREGREHAQAWRVRRPARSASAAARARLSARSPCIFQLPNTIGRGKPIIRSAFCKSRGW